MRIFSAVVTLVCAALAGTACAADVDTALPQNMWFVHVGAAGVFFDSGANSATPAFLPGYDVRATDNYTGTVEVGRFLTENFSVSLAAGLPPTNDLWITLNDADFRRVGSVTYGSLILGGQYHLNLSEHFKPYVGAGASYNITLDTKPNNPPFSALDVSNSFGAVLQAGVDLSVTDHVGLFVDAKKMFASTTVATPTRVVDAHMNPWIVSAGLGFNF